MNLNRKNLDIAALAPTEESRFTLKGILVSNEGTVVTNGAYLVHVSLPEQTPVDQIPELPGFTNTDKTKKFILPKDAASEISKAIPKSKVLPTLNHAYLGEPVKDGTASFMTNDMENPRVFMPPKMEGSFPDYERVIPRKEDARFSVSFDLDVLMPVIWQAKKFFNGSRYTGVVLRFTTPSQAVRLDCQYEGQTFTGVVMPMRLKDVDVVDKLDVDIQALPSASPEEKADRVIEELGAILGLAPELVDSIRKVANGRLVEVLR